MTPPQNVSFLKRSDEELIRSLERRLAPGKRIGRWRNQELERGRALCKSEAGLARIRKQLERAGAFQIRVERRRWRDADGDRRTFTLARAASTKMWPMGTHYWVRDNSIIGARYLFSGDRKLKKLGKEILLSALTFMSSAPQLLRCQRIIESRSRKFRDDPEQWPYIFASVEGNLNAAQREPWGHKQDAWQITVFYVLEAIEEGLLSVRDLSKKHRAFIGYIIPFLAKISFWEVESSGSWEELPAIRTSVRAWEHRLIVKLAKLSTRRDFAFIERGFRNIRKHLRKDWKRLSLQSVAAKLERQALVELLRDLPGESPRYKRTDARYRDGDAALIYLLSMDYPYFLAARLGVDHEWAHNLEAALLRRIGTLEDDKTGGIYRYGNDSYQRSGFFRNLTAAKLTELYGGPSGDASTNFVARDRIVPKGRKAAWTHFVWQLAAWSGRRFLDTGSLQYRRMHEMYFMRGMSLFTGKGEATIDQDTSGSSRVISVPQLRMPECYISEVTPSGRALIFPSPHTPLNWAVAEMLDAFGVRRRVLKEVARSRPQKSRKTPSVR